MFLCAVLKKKFRKHRICVSLDLVKKYRRVFFVVTCDMFDKQFVSKYIDNQKEKNDKKDK